jgi:hypothetical protein
MEILIVGGALVALMVYVSTRIKKSAARAYERETVETEEFSLVKSEGFIIPVNENSEYVFEARSKDYGDEEAHQFPKVSVKLKVSSDSNFETVCRNTSSIDNKITSENFPMDDSAKQKVCLLESKETESGISFDVFHKIVESSERRKIYDLKISVLQENREQYDEQMNEMIASFQVK